MRSISPAYPLPAPPEKGGGPEHRYASTILTIPGWHFDSLTGDRAGTYSVGVNGNWRLTFTMTGADAFAVNLEDDHCVCMQSDVDVWQLTQANERTYREIDRVGGVAFTL